MFHCASTNPNAGCCTWIEAILNSVTNSGIKGLRSALQRGFSGYWWIKIGHELVVCICSPETLYYTGLCQKKRDQQIEGGKCPPLLLWSPTYSTASNSEAPRARRTWTCKSKFGRGPQNEQRPEDSLLWRKTESAEIFCLEKRRLREDLIMAFQYLKGADKKDIYKHMQWQNKGQEF